MDEALYQMGAFLNRVGVMPSLAKRTEPAPITKALREWQATYGLAITGVVDAETLAEAESQGLRETEAPTVSTVKPLSYAAKVALLGQFAYRASPLPGNPEAITVEGSWARDNLVTVLLPIGGVRGAPSSGKVQCHRKVAGPLVDLFEAWRQAGLLSLLVSWDGLYVPRFVRGSAVNLSSHSWGSAFDINASENPLKSKGAPLGAWGCVYPLVPLAEAHGFYSGGFFAGRQDWQHFEIAAPSV